MKVAKEYNEAVVEMKKSQLIRKEHLYDFGLTYECTKYINRNQTTRFHDKSYIQMLMEKVLCVPASEAICERLFRHSSLFAKRQYVTKLNNSTVHDITFVKHYLKVIWDIFVEKKDYRQVLGNSD